MQRKTVVAVCCVLVVAAGCRWQKTPAPARQKISKVHEVRVGDPAQQGRLQGVLPGEEGWRWTERVFSVTLDPPDADAVWLEFDFGLAQEITEEHVSQTIIARANGIELCRQTYHKDGRYMLACYVPVPALKQKPVKVELEAEHTVPGGPDGHSKVGLMAVLVALRPYEETDGYRESRRIMARRGYEEVVKQRGIKLPKGKQDELVKLFHQLPVWQNVWFQDVRILKNPLDLWMVQQIIWETRPDFIIETGTWKGAAALYYAYTLRGAELWGSRVLTVDIQNSVDTAAKHDLWKEYVRFFLGSSTDPKIFAQIEKLVKGKKVLVTLDSDHSTPHVLKEMKMYGELVSPGSYLIVEDTHLDGAETLGLSNPGPMAAVQEFLQQGGSQRFERDYAREAFVITYQPGGWLRRK